MIASEKPQSAGRKWLRRIGLGVAVVFSLLIIFHRPLLHSVGTALAIHYAAKENLKVQLSIEGSVFTGLTLRNIHVTPTGPTAVERVDIKTVHAEYDLIALMRHGPSELIKTVEIDSANVVLDPSKALPPKPPRPDEKFSLPKLFPEQLRLADVNVLIRSVPQDLIIEHANIDLNPHRAGELRIERLQIPGVHTWSRLFAATSYTNKNLLLRDLLLEEQNEIRLINIDASQLQEKSLRFAFDSSLAGGGISGAIALTEVGATVDATVRLTASNVSLEALTTYFGQPPGAFRGNVRSIAVDWSGTYDTPRSWNGSATLDADELFYRGFSIDASQLRLVARDGLVTLQAAEIRSAANTLQLEGTAELPEAWAEFGRRPASIRLRLAAPDLKQSTAFMVDPMRGTAEIQGRVDIANGNIAADLTLSANQVGIGDLAVDKVTGTIRGSKQMPPANVVRPYYEGLTSNIQLEATTIRSGDYALDAVAAAITTSGKSATINSISATRAANVITAAGTYELPPELKDFGAQPADVNLTVAVPEIANYWGSGNAITGALQANGTVSMRNGVAAGQLSLFGNGIRKGKLVLSQLSSDVSLANNVVYLNDLTASLNEHDYIAASGTAALGKPYRYTGNFSGRVADLATFKPLLAASGNTNDIGGSLAIDWHGSGDAAAFKNSGQLKVTLDKGRYANMQALQANIDANYTPDGLDVPIVFLGSDKMDFQANLQAKGETLEISKIQVDQGQSKYAAGYVSIPFVWKNIGTAEPLFPPTGNVTATFQSENLDLKKLFDDLGIKQAPTGFINLKIEAGGTLENLTATLDMHARDLRTAQLPGFEPATFDLGIRIEHDQLVVGGKLQQAKVQPVQIDANLPFNIAKLVEAKKLDENTPINAHVRMAKSSINFARQFAPAFSDIDGDVTLDVNVNGTIAKPVFSGAGDINVNVARFNNPTLPALTNFKSRLNFDRDVLTFTRFGGDLAGGPFGITGRITFPKLTEPTFDVHLKAQAVLVARNDSLTARADANLNVVGPLKAATVSGDVAITNSQFLKNIDLIPIGLPGRPAPRPPSDRPNLSFPQPPLRDWKFDVSIKTKDPFLIRGNLANGGALVDMKFVGTGLHPGLTGQVRLENVEATLPFSRLQIAYGFLYFDPVDSLNPKIDLHGTSVIRDYIIHVYVYGTSTSPEAIFTSEPPLPQEEIISLLATGTTRQELTGNSNVLAGRAGMLLVQQLYRKVFKKGAPTKSNSVFDRLQVDVGTPDPRTGQQSASARFKLNEQFVLIGDIGLGGDFRGMVKYLIRFR